MTDAAFRATFADFKLVKTRKTAQLIFEVPVEGADAALNTLGGLPRPDAEIWCAIARLDPKAAAREPRKAVGERPAKEPEPFATLPLAKQAAIRCADPLFWKYLNENHYELYGPDPIYGWIYAEDKAAQYVRALCGVESRAQLGDDIVAAGKWRQINRAFLDWKHAVPIEEPVR